jgi:dolichol-phosphate mannosyltransferase
MNLIISKIINNQFIKYGLVGVLSVVIDYILLYISFSILSLTTTISVTIGFWGSTIFNFVMHRFYTFSDKNNDKHIKILAKYILLVVCSYFITLAFIDYFLSFGINVYISKLITLAIVYIYGFFIGKYFVFN